jgi:cytochrome oxidase Cu insertion factor (SCO1/SenC/PrrC family)
MTDTPHEQPPQEPPREYVRPGDSPVVPIFLSLLVLIAIAFGAWTWWKVHRAEAARGAIPAGIIGPAIDDFTFTERSGKPLTRADLNGKVWVATYFFTTCPGNCITVNRNIQGLHNLPELKDVIWVSITCDPDTDTVEMLKKYADLLKADPNRWLFVRADLEYTQRVAKGMNVYLARKGHQDRAIVYDKAGRQRGIFDAMSTSDCRRMRTLLIELEAEEPPQNVAASSALEKKSS